MGNTPPWGPTGETVYTRTYSRVKPDGNREVWSETVERVAAGNLSLVYGPRDGWGPDVEREYAALVSGMGDFRILPAGRHLWASGVSGRQYLFNCHVAPWADRDLIRHTSFLMLRLAEGGGVGANYSTRFLPGVPSSRVTVHPVCKADHADYDELERHLSGKYCADWPGAVEVEDTREGWSDAVSELIRAAYDPGLHHDARVFDVSRIRPKGARLKTMGGTASGPYPLVVALNAIAAVLNGARERVTADYGTLRRNAQGQTWVDAGNTNFADHRLTPMEAMEIDHAIASAIVAGGARRSARMSIVAWDDPYVFDFIRCKADTGNHWTTNISVQIDGDYLAAIGDGPYPDGCDARERAWARDVHHAIVRGMLTNGEPGFWNSTLSNVGEPNEVVATNPCGEIALRESENCNLGHVNLDAFVGEGGRVDWVGLADAHRLMARFLIRATYGDVADSEQARVLAENRRIGVGHFGLHGYLVKRGLKFSEAARGLPFPGGTGNLADALIDLSRVVDWAAREYAHDLRVPVPVKMRTVAPTGTIAKMPGRTEGIHPVYARHFVRRVRFSASNPGEVAQVAAFRAEGYEVEKDLYAAGTNVVSFPTEDQLVSEVRARGLPVSLVESVDEISLEDMLSMQALYQECWADNAVSFTVNISASGTAHFVEPDEGKVRRVGATLAAYLPRLKGTTVMVDGTRPQAPYHRLTEDGWARMVRSGPVTVDASYDEECASGACPVR